MGKNDPVLATQNVRIEMNEENRKVAPAGRLHWDPPFGQGDDGNDDDDNEARAGDGKK